MLNNKIKIKKDKITKYLVSNVYNIILVNENDLIEVYSYNMHEFKNLKNILPMEGYNIEKFKWINKDLNIWMLIDNELYNSNIFNEYGNYPDKLFGFNFSIDNFDIYELKEPIKINDQVEIIEYVKKNEFLFKCNFLIKKIRLEFLIAYEYILYDNLTIFNIIFTYNKEDNLVEIIINEKIKILEIELETNDEFLFLNNTNLILKNEEKLKIIEFDNLLSNINYFYTDLSIIFLMNNIVKMSNLKQITLYREINKEIYEKIIDFLEKKFDENFIYNLKNFLSNKEFDFNLYLNLKKLDLRPLDKLDNEFDNSFNKYLFYINDNLIKEIEIIKHLNNLLKKKIEFNFDLILDTFNYIYQSLFQLKLKIKNLFIFLYFLKIETNKNISETEKNLKFKNMNYDLKLLINWINDDFNDHTIVKNKLSDTQNLIKSLFNTIKNKIKSNNNKILKKYFKTKLISLNNNISYYNNKNKIILLNNGQYYNPIDLKINNLNINLNFLIDNNKIIFYKIDHNNSKVTNYEIDNENFFEILSKGNCLNIEADFKNYDLQTNKKLSNNFSKIYIKNNLLILEKSNCFMIYY